MAGVFSNECWAAGDPSFYMRTNVTVGDKKMDIMRRVSKMVSETFSKPESNIVVSIQDQMDMIWDGQDSPCAVMSFGSNGTINQTNNAKFSSQVAELLEEELGIPNNRYYIVFMDIARENVGHKGVTLACLPPPAGGSAPN